MIVVSVVIPIYNAAQYIERCLDRFVAQTFDDFELVLVNDGSTDGSGDICVRYAAEHSNIRVVHQLNKGVGAARQAGLELATGKYVIFADPDDWVEPTMLYELFEKAETEQADVVLCDFFVNNELEEHHVKQCPSSLKANDVFRQLILGELHGSTWNKLYRLQMLRENGVSFPIGVNYCEDLWFNCEVMLSNPHVAYLGKAYYHYDMFTNDNSLSRKVTCKTLQDYKSFISYAINHLEIPQDDDIIYHLKYTYKRHAFRSDCRASDYCKIYPELRSRFVSTLKSSNHPQVYKITELLALSGYPSLGRCLIRSYEKLIIPFLLHMKMTISKFSSKTN